jgi:hypothetical protein
MKVSVTAIAAAAFAAIGLAGCAATGQIATSVSALSPTTTGGGICAVASTAKATLPLSADQTAVVNAALASCAAANNGQSVTDVSGFPALIAAVATLDQAGLIK